VNLFALNTHCIHMHIKYMMR